MRQVLLNPWRELDQLHSEVNRMFSGRSFPWTIRGIDPAVNLWKNEHGYVLTTELPGVAEDALDITVTKNAVTIKGSRPQEALDEKATWVRRERPEAAFERTVELPDDVDPASAEASFDKGVLTIKLARPAEQRPTRLAVRRG